MTSETDMTDSAVNELLDDLQRTKPALWEVVQAARRVIRSVAPDAAERVMYGGFMFGAGDAFCGVFAYKAHVSVEFGNGVALTDPHGCLEGAGKRRRHIKLQTVADIDDKHLRAYVVQAQDHAGGNGGDRH